MEQGPIFNLDLDAYRHVSKFQEGLPVSLHGIFKKIGQNLTLMVVDSVEFEQNFSGTMESGFGVGGESTGYELRTNDGQRIEMDLSYYKLSKSFEPGSRAMVIGFFTQVTGVETATRKVLRVTAIAVR